MVSKFLLAFFTIFFHVSQGVVITDHNSNCEFDVIEVKCIGLIEIDSSFLDYVLDKNISTFVVGTQLQSQLLDYIQSHVQVGLNAEKEGKYFQYVNNLIHSQEVDNPEKIMKIGNVTMLAIICSSDAHLCANEATCEINILWDVITIGSSNLDLGVQFCESIM